MQPTTVTNKNIANGVPKKRTGKSDDDSSAPDSPLELQNLLQALRAMRAGDFSVRMTGEEDGLLGKIADTFNDIVAANQRMLGWSVLSQLKQNPLTRHIPVQIITLDEDKHHGLARGAFSFVSKPTTTEGVEAALRRIKEYAAPRRKRLLVVEDNPAEQMSISELLGHADIGISLPGTGEQPTAPVFIDGKKAATLRGATLTTDFKQMVVDYIERRWGTGAAPAKKLADVAG